jgi:transcriptional regulator with AAA-type ATPase domain
METLPSITRGGRPGEEPPQRPYLFVVFDCDAPLGSASRHELTQIDEITVGRGEARRAERTIRGARRCLGLALADRRVSQQHARIVRRVHDWMLEDAGSSNGTRLNGATCTTPTPLKSGDLIEVGHTFLLFKTYPGDGAEATPDVELECGAGPLATLAVPWGGLLAQLPRLATASLPVVLNGETGTGKEVLARAIHVASGRRGPFVAVNCGAIAASLFEAELFGYRRGAFSGAVEDRTGLLRAAEGGTILFDEVAELAPSGQAALLRALQEREVLPVGATSPVTIDVRVLSATHNNLETLVEAGRFRADLLARLRGRTITLPSVRHRQEDLGLFIGTLVERLGRERASHVTFSSRAARALLRFHWPLNVRQLEKALEGALILAESGEIDLPHLPEELLSTPTAMTSPPGGEQSSERLPQLSDEDRARREELVALLRLHGGNISAVARAMGKARVQIQRWIRRYGIAAER